MVKSTENKLSKLSEKVREWIDELGWLLVPPFSELTGDFLMDRIRKKLCVDAVALFLTPDDDPNQLRFSFGVGYKNEYRNTVYFLNQPALTSYVFSTKKPLNMSANDLVKEQEKRANGHEGIPFTGKCKDYIDTGKFKNILAVPVVFEKSRLGVLKLENKEGTTESDNFSPEDDAIVQILASMVAIVRQQRIYSNLWAQGELAAETCRSQDDYIKRVAEILSRTLSAECCSLFIKEKDPVTDKLVLMCYGGVGYKSNYSEHRYLLPGENQKAESLTAYIAQEHTIIRATEKQLSQLSAGRVPYTGACRQYIASGTFRNILGIALVESEASFGNSNAPCWGVLKVENKKPEEEEMEFGVYDEAVCKAFVIKQIVPTLSKFKKSRRGRRAKRKGLNILIKELGPSVSLEGNQLMERFKEVLHLKSQNKEITDKDCISYLQMTRTSFYRKKKDLVANSSD